MSEDNFDYEFDQVMQRVVAVEKEVKALKEPQSRVVLTSPDGKLQIALQWNDGGTLMAGLLVKEADGSYQPKASTRLLAATFDPNVKSWYLAGS